MRFCSAYIQESEVDQIIERKFCIIVCEINFFMFFFSATVDVVSLLTATTTISLVGVVVFTLYTLKLNCILSRNIQHWITTFPTLKPVTENMKHFKEVMLQTPSE